MAKMTVKPRSGEKDAVLAMSKKSKSLEKKTSKKNSTMKSPEAKKVSLAVKKEMKNMQIKKEPSDTNAEATDASPEKEIKLQSKVLLKPKEEKNKVNRFDEMKKIHKVLEGKKLMKIKREPEDEDSDESADEDDEACKSYAQDFGIDDDIDCVDDSEDEPSQEKNVEPKKGKDGKPKKGKNDKEEGTDAKPEEGTDAKPTMKREFTDVNDPFEQARTILIKNVSLKTSRKQISNLLRSYGNIISVRLRDLPVLKKAKGSDIKMQVKLKQFKKEATSCSAYVKFQFPKQATAALAANLSELDGHHLFMLPVLSKSGEEKRRALASGCQIVVGNLPYSMESEPLYKEFSSCGDIVDISVAKNKYGNCNGVAFVQFKDKASVKTALTKAGVTLQGREIRVNKAVKKLKKSQSAVTKAKNTTNKKNEKASPSPNKQTAKKRDTPQAAKKRGTPQAAKKRGTPQAAKKRFNKDELKKLSIARKLAAKK